MVWWSGGSVKKGSISVPTIFPLGRAARDFCIPRKNFAKNAAACWTLFLSLSKVVFYPRFSLSFLSVYTFPFSSSSFLLFVHRLGARGSQWEGGGGRKSRKCLECYWSATTSGPRGKIPGRFLSTSMLRPFVFLLLEYVVQAFFCPFVFLRKKIFFLIFFLFKLRKDATFKNNIQYFLTFSGQTFSYPSSFDSVSFFSDLLKVEIILSWMFEISGFAVCPLQRHLINVQNLSNSNLKKFNVHF